MKGPFFSSPAPKFRIACMNPSTKLKAPLNLIGLSGSSLTVTCGWSDPVTDTSASRNCSVKNGADGNSWIEKSLSVACKRNSGSGWLNC